MEGTQIEWEWVCVTVLRNSQGTPQQQQRGYITGQQCFYVDCLMGFPDGSDGKESACNVGDLGLIPGLGRSRFDPWVGKIPWRRKQPPTPIFWPGEFHGMYSPWGHKESDTTE